MGGGFSNTVGGGEQKRRENPDEFARCDWWKVEPDVGRVADGVSHRMDRLRCLGNAVVPQQIYPVFAAIAEFERDETCKEKR